MRRLLLAAFVAYHAVAVAVSSIPSAGSGLRRSNWADPTVQEEFATWAGMLGVDGDRLQDQVYAAAVAWQGVRDALATPFQGYLRLTNSRQSWKMFVAAHRYPTRVEIAVFDPGSDWVTVFRERDPEADWMAERFATERVRASVFAWAWPSGIKRWTTACKGFAAQLFAEREGITAVRCQFVKARSPSPREVIDGAVPGGEATLLRVVQRPARP